MKKKATKKLDTEKLSGLILTRELTSKEKEKAKQELAEARARVQSTLTGEDRLAARILQSNLN